MRKKLLALILCLVLVVLPMCVMAQAADPADYPNDYPNDYQWEDGEWGNPESQNADPGEMPAPITTRVTVDSAFVTRLDLPEYATNFYTQLVRGSDNNSSTDIFCNLNSYAVDTGKASTEKELNRPEDVSEACYREMAYYGTELLPEKMEQGEVYSVDVTGGDKSVNLNVIEEGDLVMTSSFNGIYVTSVVKGGNSHYSEELTAAKNSVLAAAHAFDRDHPEVFWMSGVTKIRIITSTVTRGSSRVQVSFLFYVLADSTGFSVLRPEYAADGAIKEGISERDAAIKTILATVPEAGTREKIQALNKWLTEHNEYNTTPDLNSLGYGPHRCLGALVGSTGTEGPVCEGYARAFKVLCDQLQIPCVLEDGYAKASSGGAAGLHMWNSVLMPDDNWYAVDITWDDPIVSGRSGAVSGYENENYLLVGYSTVINGMRFDASHQMSCQMEGGMPFAAGPYLNSISFGISDTPAAELPFTDVPADAYFKEAVAWALANKVTNGISDFEFGPELSCTRGQVVTFLWRAMGDPRPTTQNNPFTDVDASDFYYSAVLWAAENGITTGTSTTEFSPHLECTQAQIITFLWRALGREGDSGNELWYADAVAWAEKENLLSSSGKEFKIAEMCPRADVVTYLFLALTK